MSRASAATHTGCAHTLRQLSLSFAVVWALLVSTGCAVLPTPILIDRASAPAHTLACADWYAALDVQTDLAGVRDAGAARIAGFPDLRVDRFTASLVSGQAGHTAALVERLQQLDLQARRFELANLPPQTLAQLADSVTMPANPSALWLRTQDCAQTLGAYTLASQERTASLLQRLHVPDDYATSYRLLGVYALTRYPFASGIRRFEAQRSAVFASAGASPAEGASPPIGDTLPTGGTLPAGAAPTGITRLQLSPPAQPLSSALKPAQIRRMLEPSAQDPLRVPAPTPEQAEQLLAHFAPSFNLAIQSNDDKPGALVWRPGLTSSEQDTLEVDTQTPVVYSQLAHTRYGPHSLLQLVYTLWFPARPVAAGSTLDLLAGKLDGITWRVTLAPDGTPLVYDTIHPCGCYHMFFPTPSAQARPAPQPGIEWAFIPQTLPHLTAQQQLVVHVAASTHYIDRVSVEPVQPTPVASANAAQYAWRSYDSLRSLPTSAYMPLPAPGAQAPTAPAESQATHRSIFGPNGFIAYTDRPERFIFWPMGIARAGAMRQWGKHATAFVGRRHFDDATLMELRFEFDPVHFRP